MLPFFFRRNARKVMHLELKNMLPLTHTKSAFQQRTNFILQLHASIWSCAFCVVM